MTEHFGVVASYHDWQDDGATCPPHFTSFDLVRGQETGCRRLDMGHVPAPQPRSAIVFRRAAPRAA